MRVNWRKWVMDDTYRKLKKDPTLKTEKQIGAALKITA